MKEGSRIKTKPDRPYAEDTHGATGSNGSARRNADFRAGAMSPEQESANAARDAAKKGSLHDRLVRESGPPVLIGARGRIQINQNYFVARFCLEHLVLFEQDEGRFYLYSETDGAWHKVSKT